MAYIVKSKKGLLSLSEVAARWKVQRDSVAQYLKRMKMEPATREGDHNTAPLYYRIKDVEKAEKLRNASKKVDGARQREEDRKSGKIKPKATKPKADKKAKVAKKPKAEKTPKATKPKADKKAKVAKKPKVEKTPKVDKPEKTPKVEKPKEKTVRLVKTPKAKAAKKTAASKPPAAKLVENEPEEVIEPGFEGEMNDDAESTPVEE